MSDTGTIFAIGLALGLLVLLGIPALRSMGGVPGWAKALLPLVIAAVIAGSLAMTYMTRGGSGNYETKSEMPSSSPAPQAPGPVDEEPASPPKKAKPPEPQSSGSAQLDTKPDLEPGAGSPPPSRDKDGVDSDNASGSQGGSRGLGGAQPSSTPPPPPPPPAPSPVTEAPEPGDAAKAEWDVVPVFYGTDRARADLPERADYGNERGRRLELGRALVTVPRSHTIPQIERPWSIHIPYFDITVGEAEDPNSHFTMKDVTPLTRDEFLALVRTRLEASSRFKKHALIFVHGFNTTFDFALFRTAQIAYDLKFDGAPFCYSWPSGGGLASYTFDRERSGQSVKFLKEYIELVLDQTGAEAVSVVAHSMGNQPMLQVLKDLKAARPKGLVFNQIILAAPDVDRDSFGDITSEIQGLAKNITLYASENDTALAISRSVNGGSRAGDIPAAGPLVLPGVDTLDVTSVSTDSLGINHSGYAENNKLLKDIELLVSTGAAPSVRLPSLEVVPLGDGRFWRFPKMTKVAPP